MKPGEIHTEEDNNPLIKMIAEGEHQQLDFKFEISDAKKIARSLVAFANTDGGTLLIGVKDNGVIAGIRSDEEYYMLEGAAEMYSKPPITFSTKLYNVEGKTVLEANISKTKGTLHSAPDKDNNYKVYVRRNDQNLLANGILLKIWKREKEKKGVTIKYTEPEKWLMDWLTQNSTITLSAYFKKAAIPRFIAEKILVNFILLDVIHMELTEKGAFYSLKDPEKAVQFKEKKL